VSRALAFNRDIALRRAMETFWTLGFEAASTEQLVTAMGIGRQSLYNTFGDKRKLLLEAIRLYADEGAHDALSVLRGPGTAIERIGTLLMSPAERNCERGSLGCLLVKMTTELAPLDPEVAALLIACAVPVEDGLRTLIADAQTRGEIDPELDPAATARYLLSQMSGLQVAAMGGATAETMRTTARFAMRALSTAA
jgi:TetR/AcrR family transcriptional repressor of nem operon